MLKAWKTAASRLAVHFARTRKGVVSIIAALTIGVALLSIGAAIDVSRIVSARGYAQTIADGASLAAARGSTTTSTPAQIVDIAKTYLTENLATSKDRKLTLIDIDGVVDEKTGRVNLTTHYNIGTTFMKMFNVSSLPFTVQTEVQLPQEDVPIQVALVLDVSGSMGSTGRRARGGGSGITKIDALKSSAKDLVDSLFAPRQGRNASETRAMVRISIVPYSNYVNITDHLNFTTMSMHQRNQIKNYNRTHSVKKNVYATERTMDTYNDESPSAARFPYDTYTWQMPGSKIMPMSNNKDRLKQYIDSLQAGGGTAGHIGFAWGWYTVSTKWYGKWGGVGPAPLAAGQKSKTAIIMLTDGSFNTHYNGPVSSFRQFQKLCSAAKGDGVRVYTIAFKAPDDAERNLRECASGSSRYFDAANAADLSDAFSKIGQELRAIMLTL